MLQQKPPRNMVSLWLYRWPAQMGAAGSMAALLAAIGVALLSTAGGMQEVVIPYTVDDSEKTFTTDAIAGPALLSYQIPDFYGNQKRYVESKDNDLMLVSTASQFISKYKCEDAETVAEARWRRCPNSANSPATSTDDFSGTDCSSDPLYSNIQHSDTLPGNSFRPCGLVAMSMFTDRYELIRVSDNVNISLDESGIALDTDSQLYKNTITRYGPSLSVKGRQSTDPEERSWLRPEDLEHFQVWFRTPASPSVRNLWATIPGGLEAGEYKLRITENSKVWTEQWQVTEKRVIISKGHTLGSPGGATFLGALCLASSAMQAVMVIVFYLSKSFIPRLMGAEA